MFWFPFRQVKCAHFFRPQPFWCRDNLKTESYPEPSEIVRFGLKSTMAKNAFYRQKICRVETEDIKRTCVNRSLDGRCKNQKNVRVYSVVVLFERYGLFKKKKKMLKPKYPNTNAIEPVLCRTIQSRFLLCLCRPSMYCARETP